MNDLRLQIKAQEQENEIFVLRNNVKDCQRQYQLGLEQVRRELKQSIMQIEQEKQDLI